MSQARNCLSEKFRKIDAHGVNRISIARALERYHRQPASFLKFSSSFFRTNGKTPRRVLGMGRHAKRLIGMLLLRPRCINYAATTLEYTMHFDPSHTTLFVVVAYVASAKWVNLIYRGGNMYVDIDDDTPTVRSRRERQRDSRWKVFLGNLARARYASGSSRTRQLGFIIF